MSLPAAVSGRDRRERHLVGRLEQVAEVLEHVLQPGDRREDLVRPDATVGVGVEQARATARRTRRPATGHARATQSFWSSVWRFARSAASARTTWSTPPARKNFHECAVLAMAGGTLAALVPPRNAMNEAARPVPRPVIDASTHQLRRMPSAPSARPPPACPWTPPICPGQDVRAPNPRRLTASPPEHRLLRARA